MYAEAPSIMQAALIPTDGARNYVEILVECATECNGVPMRVAQAEVASVVPSSRPANNYEPSQAKPR